MTWKHALSNIQHGSPGFGRMLLATAALTLAAEPVSWLIQTWTDPSYGSDGLAVFIACLCLFLWSATSGKADGESDRRSCYRRSWVLWPFAISALARLAGQVFAVNTIGALTLVLDVYAIGLLLALDRRSRAISPAWLAFCFAFSLPIERIVQRLIGYGLQQISAAGACASLGLWSDKTICEGTRIVFDGRDVLVDLPCSGARGVLILLLAFAFLACVIRPAPKAAAIGGAVTLLAAVASNIARICMLAAGAAHPSLFGGVNVMEEPWHDAIGLAALALGAAPLLVWACLAPTRPAGLSSEAVATPLPQSRPSRPSLALTGLAAIAAIMIVNLPRKPIDVARREAPIELPGWLAGHPAESIALTEREQEYFTRYGGAAAKASYGVHNLLVVRTSSPLRHLHAPDECLRGIGFKVAYLGAQSLPIPTAVYRAVAPDGRSWRIDVSFISDKGSVVDNVAAAVWRQLQHGDATWTAVQRISPEDAPEAEHRQWSGAVFAALDLVRGQASPMVSPASLKGAQK